MRLLGLFMLASVCAFSQTLAEHAAAMAGGSVGSAAGKPVSDSITRIFGNTEKAAAKAASVSDRPAKAPAPAPVPDTTSESSATASQPAARAKAVQAAAVHPAPPITEPGTASAPPAPASAVPGPPTADDLRAVVAGTPRAELVARLGVPNSRITIPDESGLLETYRYAAGSVRLENGLVVAVQLAQ